MSYMSVAWLDRRRKLARSRPWAHSARAARAFIALLVLCFSLPAAAQQTPRPAQQQNSSTPAIRSQVNLIVVRAIVRDANGNPVTGLSRSDFKLFDNNKEQKISHFSADAPPTGNPSVAPPTSPAAQNQSAAPATPQKYAALFFDDYHLEFGDLVQIRDAAKRYLTANLDKGARVAIYSASDSIHVDFTDDREALEQSLAHLAFAPRFEPSVVCPIGEVKIPVYLAEQVEDLDTGALQTAAGIVRCLCPYRCSEQTLETIARSESKKVLAYNDQSAVTTLRGLDALVQHISNMPAGQRTIALVSDGFLNGDNSYPLDAVIDRALRSNVIINTLDAKGLYVSSQAGGFYERQGLERQGVVLSAVAEGTGGTFIQNTNDFQSALVRIGTLRTPSYLLGFAPANIKFDGKFHKLTVKLAANSTHYTVQARSGYFAPKETRNAAVMTAVNAQDEMLQRAVFSPQDTTALPVAFRTESVPAVAGSTQVTVTVTLDMRPLQFRKQAGRDVDKLDFRIALFDGRGTYITGQMKTLSLNLSDDDLKQLGTTGATVSTVLPVKPGAYRIRVVMLDENSQQLGSSTESVAVP
jgi:VWFA-related protein